jgi:hypothetical protein
MAPKEGSGMSETDGQESRAPLPHPYEVAGWCECLGPFDGPDDWLDECELDDVAEECA